MSIGANIKKHLGENRSVAWLSRATGIPATTLRSAIVRDSNNISRDKVYLISKALGVSMEDLTDGRMLDLDYPFRDTTTPYSIDVSDMSDDEVMLLELYKDFLIYTRRNNG